MEQLDDCASDLASPSSWIHNTKCRVRPTYCHSAHQTYRI
jgi:hypothetical protein